MTKHNIFFQEYMTCKINGIDCFNIHKHSNYNPKDSLLMWFSKIVGSEKLKRQRRMNGVQKALLPILFVNYVFGTRIIEFPMGKPRPWCSFFYILLMWSIYFYLILYTKVVLVITSSIVMEIFYFLNVAIALLTTAYGIYYDKVR